MCCLVSLQEKKNASQEFPHSPKIVDESNGTYVDDPLCNYEPRSLAQMQTNLAPNLQVTRNGGDVMKNGKRHNSIVADTLFLVETENVGPLPLHISLGCGHKFFKLLEDTVIKKGWTQIGKLLV